MDLTVIPRTSFSVNNSTAKRLAMVEVTYTTTIHFNVFLLGCILIFCDNLAAKKAEPLMAHPVFDASSLNPEKYVIDDRFRDLRHIVHYGIIINP